MSYSVRPHRRQPTRLLCPWDSPGKNTGVGCHFLLQCIKVKSESEVAQWCPTLRDPMDCSLPGSSIHGIFQARVLEWGAIAIPVKPLSSFSLPRAMILNVWSLGASPGSRPAASPGNCQKCKFSDPISDILSQKLRASVRNLGTDKPSGCF